MALLGALVLWALSFPATRVALTHFSSAPLNLYRYAIAIFVLMVYAALIRAPIPAPADWMRVAMNGILIIGVYQSLFNAGMRTVSSGPAAVIVDTIPLFTAVAGAWLLRERLTALGWVGTFIGFAGAVVIALGESSVTGAALVIDKGAFWLLGAALAFSLSIIVQKPLVLRYGAVATTAWSFVAGTVAMLWALPQTITEVSNASPTAHMIVLFMAVLPGALAFILWGHAMAGLPVAVVSSSLYLVPVLTFPVAWLWLGEVPALLSWIGASIVLTGVLIVHFKGHPALLSY